KSRRDQSSARRRPKIFCGGPNAFSTGETMKRILILLSALAIVMSHVVLGLGPIRDFSPTYDEPVHFTAGYVYWKTGRFLFNAMQHPAFAKLSSPPPLNFLTPVLPLDAPPGHRPTWGVIDHSLFSHRFIYHNHYPPDD